MDSRTVGEALHQYGSFLAALLRGGPVTVPDVDKNRAGTIAAPLWDAASIQLLIEEGRRQADSQTERYARLIDRGQALITVSLVVLAFAGTSTEDVAKASGALGTAVVLSWAVGLALVLVGLLGAAAVVVARADFQVIDATQISTWTPPIGPLLAADYAKSVVVGENHLAARTVMLRDTTRVVVLGALLIAGARMLAGL